MIAVLDDAWNYLRRNSLCGYHHTLGAPRSRTLRFTNDNDRKVGPLGQFGLNAASTAVRSDTIPNGRIIEGSKLLVWSAVDQHGAESLREAYCDYINENKAELGNLAYALSERRNHFSWRGFGIVSPNADGSFADVETTQPLKASANARIAFIFTGQGAQYVGMGRELHSYSEFRDSLNRSEQCLRSLGCQWSLLDIISGDDASVDINNPEYSHPLTTCLQIALVDILKSFGISPSVVIGHSSGEIASAYTVGALSQLAAIKVAYYRGMLSSSVMEKSGGLSMMAVGLSKGAASRYLDRLRYLSAPLEVTIACVNSPRNITLSGDIAKLRSLERWFKEDSVFMRWLRVPVAYHSPFMMPIVNDYRKAIGQLESSQSNYNISMISSVTQNLVTIETLKTADYWVHNLTSTVQFQGAFSRLLTYPNREPDLRVSHVLEIGPHNALQSPIRENLQDFPGTRVPVYVPSLTRTRHASSALLNVVGILYCAGYPADILRANKLQESARSIPHGMPTYPFNHTHTFWKESRLSTNFRFRKFGRHDLLGTRVLDWNPHIAQWRNSLRLSEVPWLEDHKINGEIIFPAAGTIYIVTEAMRQLLEDQSFLLGLQIRDINFSRPIRFAQGANTVETQLTLLTDSSNDHTTWSHFQLFVLEHGAYMECSSGFIRAVTDSSDRDRVAWTAPFMRGDGPQRWLDVISSACEAQQYDPYNVRSGNTVNYGPAFMNLENMRLGVYGEATAHINTRSWMRGTATALPPRFTIHPTTLDGMAQLLVPALVHQRGNLPTMVPVRIANVWIDCDNPACHQTKILAGAKSSFRGFRGATADIISTPIDGGRPLMYIERLETSFINSMDATNEEHNQPRLLCTQLSWKPDIELLTAEQLLFHCTRNRPLRPSNSMQKYRLLIAVCMCFIEEALIFLGENPRLPLERHFRAYTQWMKHQRHRLGKAELLVTPDSVRKLLVDRDHRNRAHKQLEESGPDGAFFMEIGRNLLKALSHETDILDLMFRDNLVDRYYEFLLADEHHTYPASVYTDLLCFKNPSMTILEVGAGTGGQTQPLLEKLSSDGVKKWKHYDYTDISPSFFEQAQTKFRRYTDRMAFRVCDISKDPVSQSFEADSYDLIIASHVLHATQDLDQSLRNIRKLLKLDGKLLLFETTQPDAVHIGFAFGLLKSWWDPLEHETRSPHSPCIPSSQWHEHLRRTGFSGVDVDIPGQADLRCQYSSIMISTAVGYDRGISNSAEFALIIDEHRRDQSEAAEALQTLISSSLGSCGTLILPTLTEAEVANPTLTIFLIEYNTLFLEGISEVDYGRLHSILIRCKSALWITRSNTDLEDPRHHLADGLGRALMSEDPKRKFTTLSLNGLKPGERMFNTVVDIVKKVVSLPVELTENNYVVHGDLPHICRISTNFAVNEMVHNAIQPYHKQERQLDALSAIHLESPGHLRRPEWVEHDLSDDLTLLGEDEIIVEVKTIGLTTRDHLTITGQLDEVDLGTEGSGIIQAAGSRSGVRPGDRVCFISPSAVSSVMRLEAKAAFTIPPDMGFLEAASIPSAIWLSYHCLVNVAHLEKDETIVIYGTTTYVYRTMTHLATLLHAKVIVATSSALIFDFFQHELQISDQDIVFGPETSLSSKIQKVTQGKGVDVIVGPLRGDLEVDLISCLAPFGRLVDTALTDRGSGVAIPTNPPMNTSRSSINFMSLFKRKPSIVLETFQRAAKIFLGIGFKAPQPLHVFGAGDIKAAFDCLQAGPTGTVTLDLDPKANISVSRPIPLAICIH